MHLKKMPLLAFFSLLVGSLFFLSSCSEDQLKRMEVTPTAYGNVDNIYLVCDDYLWNSETGDTFRMHFEALYPVTPQPEPILDVRFIDAKRFNKVVKTHRAIVILADLSDKENAATKLVVGTLGEQKIKRAMEDERYRIAVQQDRWAVGQTVIYWFAPNRQSLFESVGRDYQQVIDILNKPNAEKLLKQVYADGKNQNVNLSIKKRFNFEITIPKGYNVAQEDSTAIWVRMESEKVSSNIFMHVMNNANPKIMSHDSLIAIRNRLTKQYFSSWVEGSYMSVDDKNLPVYFQEMLFGEYRALQARGVWRMEKDFMGGTFVTYLIPDFQRNRVIFIDGFVYAPGEKKRLEMRKLDTVFSTFKL